MWMKQSKIEFILTIQIENKFIVQIENKFNVLYSNYAYFNLF